MGEANSPASGKSALAGSNDDSSARPKKSRKTMVSDKVAGSPFRGMSSILLTLRLPWLVICNPLGLLNVLAARRIVKGKGSTVYGASPLALWLPTLIIFLLLSLLVTVKVVTPLAAGVIAVAVTIWTIAITCENLPFGLSVGLFGIFIGATAVVGVLQFTGTLDSFHAIAGFLRDWGPELDAPFLVWVSIGCLPVFLARLIRSRFENALTVVGNHLYVARVGGGSSLPSADYRLRICTAGYEDRLWAGVVDICIIATIHLGKVADAEDAYRNAAYVLKDVPEGIFVAHALMWATSDDVVTLRRAETIEAG